MSSVDLTILVRVTCALAFQSITKCWRCLRNYYWVLDVQHGMLDVPERVLCNSGELLNVECPWESIMECCEALGSILECCRPMGVYYGILNIHRRVLCNFEVHGRILWNVRGAQEYYGMLEVHGKIMKCWMSMGECYEMLDVPERFIHVECWSSTGEYYEMLEVPEKLLRDFEGAWESVMGC